MNCKKLKNEKGVQGKMKRFFKELFRVLPLILGLMINRIADVLNISIFDWKIIAIILITFCVYIALAEKIEKMMSEI